MTILAPYTLPFDLCREECREYVDIGHGSLNGFSLYLGRQWDLLVCNNLMTMVCGLRGLEGSRGKYCIIIILLPQVTILIRSG